MFQSHLRRVFYASVTGLNGTAKRNLVRIPEPHLKHGTYEKCIQNLRPKASRDVAFFGNLGTDSKIILKWIFEKLGVELWTVTRYDPMAGFCEHSNGNSGFMKVSNFSRWCTGEGFKKYPASRSWHGSISVEGV
jgi:hypothetical protein